MYPPVPISDINAVVEVEDGEWVEFWDLGKPDVLVATRIREAIMSSDATWADILDSGDFIYDVDFINVVAPDEY